MITLESETQKKHREMLEKINSGDITAFNRYSRWSIWLADRSGKFKDLRESNIEMRNLLDNNTDSCRESL